MQVPHIKITETHWLAASKKFTTGHTVMDVCNKAIEMALAEQSQEQLEPQQAQYPSPYKKEPTCQVRNLDAGELKTMTREAAKKLQDELGDTVEWAHPKGGKCGFHFDAQGIYTYKRKESEPTTIVNGERMTLLAAEALKVKLGGSVEWFDWSPMRSQTKSIGAWKFSAEDFYSYTEKPNLVKLDGEFMSREAAVALWESKKDTCDVWYSNNHHGWRVNLSPNFDIYNSKIGSVYQLREKPKKQATLDPAIREGVIALLQELNFIK